MPQKLDFGNMNLEKNYRLEIELPGLPKTTNAARALGHWAKRHRLDAEWKATVGLYLSNKRPPKPLEKAKLTLTRCSSVEPDYDGLVSSFKPVIDALVEAKVLQNDRVENIGHPQYMWEKAPARKGSIKVKIEEL